MSTNSVLLKNESEDREICGYRIIHCTKPYNNGETDVILVPRKVNW